VHITASHWQLLSPLLDDGLLLAPSARRAWLAQQTQLSAENHAQLAQLIALANAPETETFFQDLGGLLPAKNVPSEFGGGSHHTSTRKADEVVGPYALLHPLGRGGMAEVWLARRSDGAYERDVALKLPLTHLPKNVAAERLLRERNVLAALEHPSIARFYDAGLAADGQPFLAMEYVQGESIIEHADRLKLNLRQRSALMLQVLDALHYAHQHLVVHRDLKPSNILVREDGRVALLDFGIAKVLESPQAATQATELTHAVGNALTLAYAAPEQLLAEPVTTSTDLYSLGVVMFELLTGGRPFAHAEQSASALIRAMDRSAVTGNAGGTKATGKRTGPATEVNAGRAQIQAQERGFDTAAAWHRAFEGDLAAICAKALRNEPAERYASALSMREDVGRYLEQRPVQASAGAWAYRARKFFQRNRAAIAVAAAASIAALGLGGHAWQKTQDSQVNAARATAVEGVVKSLFAGMNPNSNTARTFTAKELLDKSRPLMLQAGAANAESRSKTNMMMGKLYLDIGALAEAAALFETEIAEARAAGDVRREVWAQCLLADADMDQRKFQLAYDNMARARAQLQPLVKQPELLLAEVDYRLGTAAYFIKNYGDADRYLKTAKAALIDPSVKSETALETLVNVVRQQGVLARFQGDFVATNGYFLEAQKLLQNTPGLQLTKDALDIERLPLASNLGRYDEAIKESERLLSRLSNQASANQTYPVATAIHYVTALMRTGRLREAREQINRIKSDAVVANDALRLNIAKNFTASISLYSGDANTALREFNEQLAFDMNPPGKIVDVIGLQANRRNIAHCLLQLGRTAEALALLRNIELTQIQLLNNDQHGDIAYTRLLLGVALMRQNELPEAAAVLARSRDAMIAKRGANHWAVMLADAYLALMNASENPSAAPSANAVNLADRVQRELGWQHGAPELAARLKGTTQSHLVSVPVVL
jgi:eukaryotic-like serine/threonine-protein kinase